MAENKDMKLVDVGAGRLIPQGNLNTNVPGTLGSMMKSLDAAYKSAGTFKASTSYGFTPGYTTKGLEGNWGQMTNSKCQ